MSKARLGLMMLLSGVTIIGFQNCAGPQGFDGQGSVSSTESSANRSGPGVSESSATGRDLSGSSSVSQDEVRVISYSSDIAQTDCSKSGANLVQKVENAPVNLRVCLEYVLDMPVGHARYNEQYFCDSSAKFKEFGSDWNYSLASRTLRRVQEPYPVNNSAFLVPGTYWMVVMDQTGQIHRSPATRLARKGQAHCQQAAAAASCGWSGIVPGPVAGPMEPCTSSNNGRVITDDRNIEFTCVCR